MRYVFWLIVTMFLVMSLFFQSNQDADYNEVIANMSNLQNVTFNLTNNALPYTDLYNNDMTVKNVVFNIGHSILYAFIVEINTLIPIATYVASGEQNLLLFKLAIVYMIFCIVLWLPEVLKGVIAIYFFIKEKKKYKEKFYH